MAIEIRKLQLEIDQIENGYVVFEGNSFGGHRQYVGRKWVCHTPKELGDLVISLAQGYPVGNGEKSGPTKAKKFVVTNPILDPILFLSLRKWFLNSHSQVSERTRWGMGLRF